MDSTTIDQLLKQMDGSGSDAEWEAVKKLRALNNFPVLLLEKYGQSKRWSERASCVYHAVRYAKESPEAFQLGILALEDKSKVVRYRAAMLLAVAQNPDALPALSALVEFGSESSADAKAAVSAIRGKNQNLFVDRDGSGMVTLNIG